MGAVGIDRSSANGSRPEPMMQVVAGIVVLALALLAWGGQLISWLAPGLATRWGLTEVEEAVEPVFHADVRGEAAWDALSLWTLVVAGVLIILDESSWAYFGLLGGGMFLYFGGRGIFTRLVMLRRGLRIGTEANVRVGLAFLAIWGVTALVVIVAAVRSLSTG
jgi:hypothetical protein